MNRPTTRRRLRLGALATVITGAIAIPITASAAAGGSQQASTTRTRAAGTSIAAIAVPRIGWTPCPDSPETQCGNLQVPVDWTRPTGPKVTLGVARRPATDQAHKIGTLFYNPGGPGDSPIQYVTAAEQIFSPTVRARFDIVGLAPRAVGPQARLHCTVPAFTADTTLFPRTRGEYDRLVAHNREVGLSCQRGSGDLFAHTDTVSVARDHEALRQALGVDQVTWLGLSYGTQVAANYADLFPTRTRAMVLDAALEHAQPEVTQVAGEILAVEDSFNRFTTWCVDAPACVLRGQNVGAEFDRLVKSADQNPIPVSGAVRAVTGEDIRMGTIGLLRIKEAGVFGPRLSWANLSRSIDAALHGDASDFAFPDVDEAQQQLQARLGIGCMEYVPQIHSWEQMQQRITMGKQLAPHLQGASETWQVNLCIGWPIPAANPPRTLHVSGVPAMVVHAVHDPSVAYTWAHSLAAQIRGSAVLTRTGDGHTSYLTSPCARAAIDQYLVRASGPANPVCTD